MTSKFIIEHYFTYLHLIINYLPFILIDSEFKSKNIQVKECKHVSLENVK